MVDLFAYPGFYSNPDLKPARDRRNLVRTNRSRVALVRFVARVCEMSRGRAYLTSTLTLGEHVMRDFLRRRSQRVR